MNGLFRLKEVSNFTNALPVFAMLYILQLIFILVNFCFSFV